MAATNAAGTTTVRYGKMRANVLALEAVLAGGRVVRAGSRAPKTSAGYDLLGLLIGSEGTLGVITELTVRLQGIPEQAVVLRLAFPDVESACRAATTIVAAGAGVTRVELLDGWTIAAINAHQGTDLPVGPSLFVEAAGSEGTVASDLELVREIAASEGATDVVAERDPTARARLWAARHASAYAAAAAAPGKRHRATDICVPLSELAAAVAFAREEVERRGLVAGIVGHAGDGNVHLSLHVDPEDPDEVRTSDELIELLVADALARGGTCTGEHGIGLGKVRRARAGARRPPAADARHQAGLRPARDHEPRQGAAGRTDRAPPEAGARGLPPAAADGASGAEPEHCVRRAPRSARAAACARRPSPARRRRRRRPARPRPSPWRDAPRRRATPRAARGRPRAAR